MESTQRIEPCQLGSVPDRIADLVADVVAKSARLEARLAPATAVGLADLLRLANCYYSNLIEGHVTRPRDIERALAEDMDKDRRLRGSAARGCRACAGSTVDRYPFREGGVGRAGVHRGDYLDPPGVLPGCGGRHGDPQTAGRWQLSDEARVFSNTVRSGQLGGSPPATVECGGGFVHGIFQRRFALGSLGSAGRLPAIPIAHHRLNYIHPFPDGNGRTSRLMSHAMALRANIGAHGLWSVSRGLARGLPGRPTYQEMMDHADTPRSSATDGRGNLSLRALGDSSSGSSRS